MELAERRVLASVDMPGDTEGGTGRLKDAPVWRAMLLDRARQVVDARKDTFGSQLIQ